MALLLGFLLTLTPLASWAQEQAAEPPSRTVQASSDLTNLGLEQLLNVRVTTATRSPEPIERTGSSVTVITRDQIRKMGAHNLIDILRVVPGFGITQNAIGQYQIEVRGFQTLLNPHVLVLLDGNSINNDLEDAGFQWGYGPLIADNIKRVEIVRGPGSALYGADAFLAVINVITLDAIDLPGPATALTGGSFGTYQPDLFYGWIAGHSHVAINYNYDHSDGFHGFMARDVLGNSGQTLYPETHDDLDVKAGSGQLNLHGHLASTATGPFVGIADALNTRTRLHFRDWFLELRYAHPVSGKLTIEPRIYYDVSQEHNFLQLFPDGAFMGAFPQGAILDAGYRNSKLGAEFLARSDLGSRNRMVAGFSAERQRLSDVTGKQNYDSHTFAPFPDGLRDVTNDPSQIWGLNTTRNVLAAFGEDIWDIQKRLRAVIGARFDHYSDFGGTFNPRTSLTWEFKDGYHLRALYGSAFRAPSFGEINDQNNRIILGSLNLRPEKIDTFEIGVSAQINPRIEAGITGFRNKIKDLIIPGAPFVNHGRANATGVEIETSYNVGSGSSLGLNCTFQDARDETAGQQEPNTPKRRANLTWDTPLGKDWHLFLLTQLKGSTARAKGDTRPDVPGYGLLDATISSGDRFLGRKGVRFSLSIRNLLNKSYTDASPPSGFGILDNSDYPKPGRTFYARLSYGM